MSWLNKCSFAIVIIVVLCVIASSIWLITMERKPKAVDVETKRKRNSKKCDQLRCITKWFQEEDSDKKDLAQQLFESCNREKSKLLYIVNSSYHTYLKGDIDKSFYVKYYEYTLYRQCHEECGVLDPFQYHQQQSTYTLMFAKVRMNGIDYFCRNYPEGSSCSLHGLSVLFGYYFSYFSIPATIFLNALDLSIMRQALKTSAGPAVYFHSAEIVTDGLLNILIGLTTGLSFFSYVDLWANTCGFYTHVIHLGQSAAVLKSYVNFLNQLFITGMTLDRFYGLAKPLKYNEGGADSLRKRGRKLIILVLFSSFLFYYPFIIFNIFKPIFIEWRKGSDQRSDYYKISTIFNNFQAAVNLSLVIIQIIASVLVEKSYRKFLNSTIEQENREQVKQQERDKQKLLIGTVGLNIITTLISSFLYITNQNSFYVYILGVDTGSLRQYIMAWYRPVMRTADRILVFANGNGALVFHLIFIKSYRSAFKHTTFGRLLFTQQVQPTQATTSGNTTGQRNNTRTRGMAVPK